MSPSGTASVCAEHGALAERVDGVRKDVDRHEGEIGQLVRAVARIEGAWKMAVVLGTLVGTAAGILARLIVR